MRTWLWHLNVHYPQKTYRPYFVDIASFNCDQTPRITLSSLTQGIYATPSTKSGQLLYIVYVTEVEDILIKIRMNVRKEYHIQGVKGLF